MIPLLWDPGYELVRSDAVVVVNELLSSDRSTRVNSVVLTAGEHPKLSELRGLGKEIWGREDAQDYVNQLRDEWR